MSLVFFNLEFGGIVHIRSSTLSPSFLVFYVQIHFSSSVSFGVIVPSIRILAFIVSHLLSFSSPCYPVLIAYSSLFFQISYTSEWFDRYSSLSVFWVTFGDVLEGAWVFSVASETFWDIIFPLGLEPLCSSLGLSEFVFHRCPYGGLLSSSVEFTSLHSLFTLSFHSSVHISYIRELYRRGAYLQTPIWVILCCSWFCHVEEPWTAMCRLLRGHERIR